MSDSKRTVIQVAGATALVTLLAAGTAGYFIGYYKGQEDLKRQVADAVVSAFRGMTNGGAKPADSPQGKPPPTPIWEVSEDKSPVDGSKTIVLGLDASKAPQGSFGAQDAARLIIRCREGATDFYIATDEYLGTDAVPVIYRLDDAPSRSAHWATSTDGKAVFAPNPKELARQLVATRKLFTRISDFRGSSYDIEFQTAGLDRVLSKVSAACNWQ